MNSQAIPTGLLSFGMSGTLFHAPFIHANPKFQLAAVWERSARGAKEKYPAITVYNSLEDFLAHPSLELVVVNTPNVSHYEYTRQALLAGKHVIVEKPFTATVSQGKELIELAKKQGRLLSVYQNRRFDSDFRTIKKVLDEKLLGDIREAEFHFDRFDEQLSYKAHKEIMETGTGCLYDLGSHLIDQALVLFGMPQKLFADSMCMRPGSQVDDYFELLLYYPDFRVRLKSSYQVREALPGYIIHGRKGSFIKSKTDVQEKMLQQGVVPVGAEWGKEPDSQSGLLNTEKDGVVTREHIPSLQGNYMDYYDGIYRSIRNKEPLPVTAEDGLNVIRVIETAFRSHREGMVLEIESL